MISILTLLAAALVAEPEGKPPKLSDVDALAIRELQLKISQATLAQKQAQIDFDAAGKVATDARTKLDALVKSKEKSVCNGGRIQDDLTCSAPPKDEKKEGKQ